MIGNSLIRKARQQAGLTQRALGERMGTTQSVVARWEAGHVSPRLNTFERLLHACGFEPRIQLVRAADPDLDQLTERLAWSPKQRLDYLRDMLAFEGRAHRAKRVAKGR